MSRRQFVALGAAGVSAIALAGPAQAVAEDRLWQTVGQFAASGAIGRVRNASILLHDAHTSIDVRALEAVDRLREALNLPEPVSSGFAHNPLSGWFSMSCRFSTGVTFAVAAVSGITETRYTIRGERGGIHVEGARVYLETDGHWTER